MIYPYIQKLIRFAQKKVKINYTNNTNIYQGFYPTWKKASAVTYGYQDKSIFDKVKKAALEVQKGKALFERDSVLFYQRVYNWPLLSVLQKIAGENKGIINIIDYGGSLGSTYFQHKDFLSACKIKIRWNIVEQKHFVSFGKKKFTSEELKFYYSFKDCLQNTKPNIILASSFIGYVDNPWKVIKEIISSGVKNIIIERTAFINSKSHKILIQKVSPLIYEASYPMWAFNYEKFIRLFTSLYIPIVDFASYCHTDEAVNSNSLTWKGIYFVKKG